MKRYKNPTVRAIDSFLDIPSFDDRAECKARMIAGMKQYHATEYPDIPLAGSIMYSAETNKYRGLMFPDSVMEREFVKQHAIRAGLSVVETFSLSEVEP